MENIVLVGYMGCGKTTVGKKLAKLKGYAFADTDEMIEKQQHRSIGEIFSENGEAAFRMMETELLRQLIEAREEHLVISTGGGMPVKEENRALLSALGTVAYLKAKPRTIYRRTAGDTSRPLLQCKNPLEKITQMIEARGPAYEAAATETIEVDTLQPSEAAEEIIRRIYG